MEFLQIFLFYGIERLHSLMNVPLGADFFEQWLISFIPINVCFKRSGDLDQVVCIEQEFDL